MSLTWSDEGQSLGRGPGSLSRPCVGTDSVGHVGQREGQIDRQLSVQSGVHHKLYLKNRETVNVRRLEDFLFTCLCCVVSDLPAVQQVCCTPP